MEAPNIRIGIIETVLLFAATPNGLVCIFADGENRCFARSSPRD